MIPSIGFSEMLLLAVLAIIFVGPKDMPAMMRTAGRWVAKVKLMGQEFKDAFDEMGKETELAELRKEIEDLKSMGGLTGDLDEDFSSEMREIDRDIRDSVDKPHPRVPEVKSEEAGNGET